MKVSKWLGAAFGLMFLGCANTSLPPKSQTNASASASMGNNVASTSYLDGKTIDLMSVLPPAPKVGDARYEADRRIFRETRKFEDTPRWQMASDDADSSSGKMFHHFSCSLGIELTPQQAPKILQVAQKAMRDASVPLGKAKDFYQRKRPFLIDEGPICRPRIEVATSFDYPSGHATAGWSWAMVLAQVAPDHAVPILERGRAIGDSRVFCGVHNASAVEGARFLASATMAMVMATPAYQDDLQQARLELATLRNQPHSTPEAARCEAEAKLVAMPVVQQVSN
jgi:acid phosphatase (class A)